MRLSRCGRDPEAPWPDAWCDLCEEAFQDAGGEWNQVSEAGLSAVALCTHCYEDARARNLHVPPLAKGARAHLTEEEQAALIHAAVHVAQDIQAAANRQWHFIGGGRWDFNEEPPTLTFQTPDHPKVIADVRYVGSYSTTSQTFQWAWATVDEGADEAVDVSRLHVFGEVRGITKLTTANWACDEADGWEMASLAGYVLRAEGLYRPPFDHVFWFMLLSNFRHAS